MPRITTLAAALAVAAVLASCSKKSAVDPSYTMPEGTRSPRLQLITNFDLPNAVITVKDRGRIGVPDFVPDSTNADSIVLDPDTGAPQIRYVQQYTPSTIRGTIINQTSAEGMQMFRTTSSGGVYQFLDFPVPVQKRFLDKLAETYFFTDPDAGRLSGASYFARGLIGGIAGSSSPLSNPSQPLTNSIAEIVYTANRNGTVTPISGPPAPPESTFTMQWLTIPGASTYWISVFQYLTNLVDLNERIYTGQPQILSPIKSRDVFFGSLPASAASFMTYKFGDPSATIYTYRTPHLGQVYYVRIAAVNAQGQLIGMTTGPTILQTSDLLRIQDSRDYFFIFGSGIYDMFSRGAVFVSPGTQ